ncbi:MAG: pro-sigmaK processing inhibitor BofA family protein [Candidatus Micrarchaeota archaeon]
MIIGLELLPLIVTGVLLFLAGLFLLIFMKKILENSVIGLIALLVINFLGTSYGVSVPINVLTIIITAFFGLAGVGFILLLKFAGIEIT